MCQFEGQQALSTHLSYTSPSGVIAQGPTKQRAMQVARGAWLKAPSAKNTPFHRWLGDGPGTREDTHKKREKNCEGHTRVSKQKDKATSRPSGEESGAGEGSVVSS